MFLKITFRMAVAVLGMAMFAFSASYADDKKGKKENLAVDDVKGKFSIMVLGSGSPAAQPDGRASAGYMIFVDGMAKILMDVGGGVYQRIADSGMNLTDLEIVLLSHLHVDHVGDIDPVVNAILSIRVTPHQTPPMVI